MTNNKPPAITGKTGSPAVGEPVYLAVGLVRRPHGVRGDVLFDVYTDFPERLRPGLVLLLGDARLPIKITRRREHSAGLILGLEGVGTPEQAAKYTNKVAYIPSEGLPPLPEGEYYHHQIVGLSVVDETGRALGIVTEILETGANDVYVVKDEAGREVLIPALKEVLLHIDLASATMKVHLLPGLVDDVDEA
jgi:16S rRNA processing protein RimM